MAEILNQSLGTPRKVLATAASFGAHADCIAANHESACAQCVQFVNLALAFHYGHLETTPELLLAITDDLLNGE